LDESTGKLFVSNLLDRENYDAITLYVTASDKYKPYKSDHAIIQIQIIDTNDNPPQFTRPDYQVNVYDDTKLDTHLIRVEAVDKDVGQNANVRYSLWQDSVSSNVPVSIDPLTGVIRLKHEHTVDTPDFSNVTLVARDLGQPSLSSKTFVLIRNIFQNDKPPYFDEPDQVSRCF
jgi:hypothetical protein